jgi:hypothetical protein
MNDWSRVPELVDAWSEKCAAPACAFCHALRDVYTHGDVGVYWQPETEEPGLYYRGLGEKLAQDISLVNGAVGRVVGQDALYLTADHLNDGPWVKVAYSPTLRRAGELLNFYPGEYPGGYPNSPSPLAATLTSGLVGAGLGYGAGWLGEHLLPAKWQRGRLRKTLAAIGGLGLATPGLLWMASNHATGHGMLENTHDIPRPGKPGFPDPPVVDWQAQMNPQYKAAMDQFLKQGDGYPSALAGDPESLKVDVNSLGQTLWEVGASPRTTAATMGAIYAAGRMPDPDAMPGEVTPRQTGLLGAMMGGGAKGYATGYLAGKALGLLTGMPDDTQNVLRNTGLALGIINAVIPKLYGQ